MMKKTNNILYILFLMFGMAVHAQTGTIEGTVTDANGEPIMFGEVFIDQTQFGEYTDENGKYVLYDIPVGTYTVIFSDPDAGATAETPDVVVVANQTTVADIHVTEAIEVIEHTATFHLDAATEDAAIDDVKDAVVLKEKVSNQEITKKGDSNASGAVGRASGASVVGGKYVFVRGLSDRYTKTMLNNSDIPGLDPNVNSVQLDMFPSNFIESIDVIKSFTPDLPGDFTGGLVDIQTRDYPDSFTVNLGISGNYNPQSSFRKDFYLYDRGSKDWMGMDDGSRAMPKEVNDAVENDVSGAKNFPFQNTDKNKAIATKFNNDMSPSEQSSLMDYKASLSMGSKLLIPLKKDSLKHRTLGYFAGISYNRSYTYFDDGEKNRYMLLNIDQNDDLIVQRELNWRQGTDNVLIGGVFNTTFKFNERHKIRLNTLVNQSGISSASITEGSTDADQDLTIRNRTMRYLQRQLASGQIRGEHKMLDSLVKNGLDLDWRYALTSAKQDDPDLRYVTDDYSVDENGNKDFTVGRSIYNAPARYYRGMDEINNDFKFDLGWKAKVDTLTFKVGGSYVTKDRNFSESRIDYDGFDNEAYNGDLGELLANPDNYGTNDENGIFILNLTADNNRYIGKSAIAGVYAMTNAKLTKRLDFVGGARFESTKMDVFSTKNGFLRSNDFLPSANLIYQLKDTSKAYVIGGDTIIENQDMKLRASYSRTLARPNFREIASFTSEDYDVNLVLKGNPNLLITNIDNFDLRWEFFPRKGEIFSVSAFYKSFTNPIELFFLTQTRNEYQWKNADKALVYGAEFEYRKRLDIISPRLKNYKIGTNFTYSYSRINYTKEELSKIHSINPYVKKHRQMSGQSPILINSYLEYEHDSSGVSGIITYNYFSDRLTAINGDGTPNIFEKGRGTLDVGIAKRFGNLKISLRFKNLLNPEYKRVYKFPNDNAIYDKFGNTEYVNSTYRIGRVYSLSISYKF